MLKNFAYLSLCDLDPFCLYHRLPKNISRREEQSTKVVTGGLRLNLLKSNFYLFHRFVLDLGTR